MSVKILSVSENNIKERIQELFERAFNFEFPLEDVRKIQTLTADFDDLKVDLHTFGYNLQSLCWLAHSEKTLKNRSIEDLKNYQQWLEKSFFERFSKNSTAEELISPVFTPRLYEKLNLYEELRKLLLILISDELL